ncbi:MAG: hypothetical protein KY462_05300 [Actinobacteria bacterium]|nr:hypothetical protein [Actinomycetota bacterium]
MVDVALGVLGTSFLVVALYDVITTTVAVAAGKGPLTSQVARVLWLGFLAAASRRGRGRFLLAGGPAVLFAVVATWVMLLVVGWTLVFAASGGLDDPSAGRRPLPLLRFAVGLVVGRVDSPGQPVGGAGQGLQLIAAASGVVLLTLTIAYIIPVVDATVLKRRVASQISTLGHTPAEVLGRAWNGTNFGDLHLYLVALVPTIGELAERHLAYPILHYFHSAERHTAVGPNVAVLDEALTMLRCCVGESTLEPSSTLPLRRAITQFLDTLREAFITLADAPAPPPDLGSLRSDGVPLVDKNEVQAEFEAVSERRRLLLALLRHDAWSWEDLPVVHTALPTIAVDEEPPTGT